MLHRRRIPLASQRRPLAPNIDKLPLELRMQPDIREPPKITWDTAIQVGTMWFDSTVEIPRAKPALVNPVLASNECPYCGVIVEMQGIEESTLW
jgi:hypothetical protein